MVLQVPPQYVHTLHVWLGSNQEVLCSDRHKNGDLECPPFPVCSIRMNPLCFLDINITLQHVNICEYLNNSAIQQFRKASQQSLKTAQIHINNNCFFDLQSFLSDNHLHTIDSTGSAFQPQRMLLAGNVDDAVAFPLLDNLPSYLTHLKMYL